MSYNRSPQYSASTGGGLKGEKREMQDLNDRLACFMAKVRALKQQKGATIDPASFLDTLKMMEDEMNRCKGMYEAEIAKLRGQLNDLSQQKNDFAAQANKNTGMAQDLQNRLAEESNKARCANDEINALKKALGQRDAEVNSLRAAVQSKDKELQDLKPALARMAKDVDDLKNRLAREAAARQQAEDAIKQMQGKSGFDSQRKDQEIKDLKDRLNATNNIIGTLQSKIKQLSQVDDANLDQLLAKIRDGTNAELARYQREMDEALNRNLGPLKRQLQEDGDAKKRLAAENEQLAKALRDLQARNAALEAEVNSLMKQKQALEGALNSDREKAAARIRELEARLQELQNLVMDKLRDNTAAQGAAASLRAEIDAYRALLEGEENKLGGGTTATKPMSASSGYGTNKIPQYTNTQPTISTRGKPPGPYTIYQTSYDRDLKSRGGSSLPGINRSNTMQPTYSYRC